MFTTYRSVRQLGILFGWRYGEWVAVLRIPDDAPITFDGPDRKGHVMLYAADGTMLQVAGAEYLRQHCVVDVVHGPSTVDLTL